MPNEYFSSFIVLPLIFSFCSLRVLLQKFRKPKLLLSDSFNRQTRHDLCAERRKVCVVFNALRIIQILARLELKKKLSGIFRSVLLYNLLALSVHVNQRNSLLGCDATDYV